MNEANFDPNDPKVKEAFGNVLETRLPSGGTVFIREQNGNDDDILSNPIWAKDGSNMNVFITAVVVYCDLTTSGKLSPKDVLNMKIRDKYHIMFMSRIHSNGHEVKFDYNWGKDEGGKVTYIEDLNTYVWDYNKPFPELGDDDYNEERIRPYIEQDSNTREFTLTSGKLVRYDYLNGRSEKFLLKLPQEKMTRNAEILARSLALSIEGKFEKVSNFTPFSTRDMQELRQDMKLYDPPFQGLTELENPLNNEKLSIPIIASPDFFYPEEI
jgi:hypothetical protein